jgi:phosphatidate cytidylyltransferase
MKNEAVKRILSSLIIIPVAFFFILKGSIFFMFFLGIFFLFASYEWIKMSKNELMKLLGIAYLLFVSYSAYLLRGDYLHTFYQFLFVIIICIFSDIGGYVFGKLFKGPKLTKISPNKTYSGMIGSFFLAIIAAYLFKINIFTFVLPGDVFQLSNLNDFNFLLIILFISFVSQIGDLIISYFKRLSKIKNTGNLIPGHGGLLDRVDGIIFAIPTSYILFKVLIS